MPETLPSLVIVGRPNVGKSTLFNRLTGTRRSIVTNEPGITRDRIYGKAEWRGRALEIVDTGGLVPDDKALIPQEILRQAHVAIKKAALLVLVVDSQAGLTPLDEELARLLRTTGKPFVVAVNKVDAMSQESNANVFHRIGVPVFPIAAEHGTGVDDLLDSALAQVSVVASVEEEKQPDVIPVAIIGRPNVGKSTLFNALLKKQQALAANYPFATIEPNVGVVPVPDSRLTKIAEITKTEHNMQNLPPILPATVTFVDIAGLVKGASQGEGLGNKFLSHIREVDAICHVVRHFSDPDIIHVAGTADPQSDKETVNTELILADLQTLEKQPTPKKSVAKKEEILKYDAIEKLKTGLNEGKLAKDIPLFEEEALAAKELHLITMKPVFYVANVSEDQLQDTFPENTLPVCAKVEEELSGLTDEEQKEYLASLGLSGSGLERIISKGYQVLNLISFLTAGEKEVRAWTITNGTDAQNSAGVIHTDFIKHFIKAEVANYDDFVSLGGWKKSREAGKVRFEGKTYVMKDGDVVEFKIGS